MHHEKFNNEDSSCRGPGLQLVRGSSPILTLFDHPGKSYWISSGSEMTPWGTLSPTRGCTSVVITETVLFLFYLFSLSPARKMRHHRFIGEQPQYHLIAHATTV